MEINALNDNFGLPGVLAFEEYHGLARVVITTPAARAVVYLQGAHLAEWQPAGQAPVLFLSEKTAYKKGKAIRGGVPVIFPWFGDRHDGKAGPAHGFARAAEWEFLFAALTGEDVHVTLALTPNEATRALGFDKFRVAYQLTIGRTLTLQLSVANEAEEPMVFEEALHTYFAVGDVREASVTGLAQTSYFDKRDNGAEKVQTEDPLTLHWTTDRLYFNTEAECVIADPVLKRQISVKKTNSATTVVWNPWSELTPGLADMDADAWPGMLCVECGNAGPNAVTLEPGQVHTMRSSISLETLGPAEAAAG